MRSAGKATLALFAIALAGGAGCGADDTQQVSAEQLVALGDAICKQGRQEFDRVQADAPPTASAAAEQADELVQIATDELNELRRIRPPDALQDRYEAYLEARGRALELLEEGRDAAREKDGKAYGMAQAKAAAEAPRRAKLARRVGFSVCSQPADG